MAQGWSVPETSHPGKFQEIPGIYVHSNPATHGTMNFHAPASIESSYMFLDRPMELLDRLRLAPRYFIDRGFQASRLQPGISMPAASLGISCLRPACRDFHASSLHAKDFHAPACTQEFPCLQPAPRDFQAASL